MNKDLVSSLLVEIAAGKCSLELEPERMMGMVLS
jgi:hypothetical protein